MFNFAINVILATFYTNNCMCLRTITVRRPSHLLQAPLSSIQRICLLPDVVIDRFLFGSLLPLHPVIEGLAAAVESPNCLYPSMGL